MTTDKCRPVEVDGEVIPVHGGAEMDATDREHFSEIVRASKRQMVAEMARRLAGLRACPDCEQGKHRNCDGQTWDNDADCHTNCPCWQAGHGDPS